MPKRTDTTGITNVIRLDDIQALTARMILGRVKRLLNKLVNIKGLTRADQHERRLLLEAIDIFLSQL